MAGLRRAHLLPVAREVGIVSAGEGPQPRRKPSWFQFSIRTLLVLTGLVALAGAALLNASTWWSGAMYNLTLLVLLISVLGSIFRRGPAQAFWLGFAIFGWVYGVFIWFPSDLLTTRLSQLVFHELVAPVEPIAPADSFDDALLDKVAQHRLAVSQYHFALTAHCVWTWLFAMLGGLLARYLYATREREP